jgi:putative endonuclease
MRIAWVYILLCADKSYYTGLSTSLEKRIAEHELGIHDGYTAARRPVKLVWAADFPNVSQAIVVERQIKRWTRKKKEALIADDFDLLKELAKSTKTKLKTKETQSS